MSGAAGAEVEVNTETGEIRLVTAQDVSKAINPLIVQSQMEGASIMGLGTALYEELNLDRARIMNSNFAHYGVPTALDTPDIKCIIVENPHPDGPFGAKEISELGTIGPPAAIANAVTDAIGVTLFELPLTPARILGALQTKS